MNEDTIKGIYIGVLCMILIILLFTKLGISYRNHEKNIEQYNNLCQDKGFQGYAGSKICHYYDSCNSTYGCLGNTMVKECHVACGYVVVK